MAGKRAAMAPNSRLLPARVSESMEPSTLPLTETCKSDLKKPLSSLLFFGTLDEIEPLSSHLVGTQYVAPQRTIGKLTTSA